MAKQDAIDNYESDIKRIDEQIRKLKASKREALLQVGNLKCQFEIGQLLQEKFRSKRKFIFKGARIGGRFTDFIEYYGSRVKKDGSEGAEIEIWQNECEPVKEGD
jgi:hypothetical protein